MGTTRALPSSLLAFGLAFYKKKKTNPPQIGDLKAEKVAAFATEPAIKKERAKPEPTPNPAKETGQPPKGNGRQWSGKEGALFALNPSWEEKKV